MVLSQIKKSFDKLLNPKKLKGNKIKDAHIILSRYTRDKNSIKTIKKSITKFNRKFKYKYKFEYKNPTRQVNPLLLF